MMLDKIINKSSELISQPNVSKKEIKKLESECKTYLTDVNKRMRLCIESFNNVSIELGEIMIKLLPNDKDTKRGNYLLKELIKIKPMEPISLFIDRVYSDDDYRTSIKNGNDTFFLEKDHRTIITTGDKDKINKLFRFKECWNDLDNDIKDVIKNMMKVLVNLTAKYIEEMDNGNEIAIIMKKIGSLQVH